MWLSNAVEFLYEHMFNSDSITDALDAQVFGSMYGAAFCKDHEDIVCWRHVLMGPNLETMLLRLKIQNESNIFNMFDSYSVDVEKSSGTSFCININIANESYPSQSGVGNGIEVVIDLETFDNGDLEVSGDGADILVTNPGDYSLAQLKGFSVSPGSAVEVHIRPARFSITQSALAFDYLDRKCVEPSVDQRASLLNGTHGVGNYSLSNCLVSAALTEIQIR